MLKSIRDINGLVAPERFLVAFRRVVNRGYNCSNNCSENGKPAICCFVDLVATIVTKHN